MVSSAAGPTGPEKQRAGSSRGTLMAQRIRFGIQTPQQNCSSQDLVSVWKTIDQAGYDTAFAFDHFFPIFSDPSGSCFEGWIALAALAVQTSKVEVGLLVRSDGNSRRRSRQLYRDSEQCGDGHLRKWIKPHSWGRWNRSDPASTNS